MTGGSAMGPAATAGQRRGNEQAADEKELRMSTTNPAPARQAPPPPRRDRVRSGWPLALAGVTLLTLSVVMMVIGA